MLDSLLDFLFDQLNSIVLMFPEATETIQAMPEDIASYTYWVGNLINVDSLVVVVTIIVSYELAMIGVRIALFIYRLLPFT